MYAQGRSIKEYLYGARNLDEFDVTVLLVQVTRDLHEGQGTCRNSYRTNLLNTNIWVARKVVGTLQ